MNWEYSDLDWECTTTACDRKVSGNDIKYNYVFKFAEQKSARNVRGAQLCQYKLGGRQENMDHPLVSSRHSDRLMRLIRRPIKQIMTNNRIFINLNAPIWPPPGRKIASRREPRAGWRLSNGGADIASQLSSRQSPPAWERLGIRHQNNTFRQFLCGKNKASMFA